jgi:2-iminobutanoate/2-iminopropanoate deaminase
MIFSMSKVASIALLFVVALIGFAQDGGNKKVVVPAGTKVGPNFSPGIQVGDTLYVSGQIGVDPKTGKVPERFEDEIKQCLENIGGVLHAGGMDYSNVVSVQVYLTDMDLFQRFNGVYVQTFKEPRPTRTAVGVVKLAAPGARAEITVTARK